MEGRTHEFRVVLHPEPFKVSEMVGLLGLLSLNPLSAEDKYRGSCGVGWCISVGVGMWTLHHVASQPLTLSRHMVCSTGHLLRVAFVPRAARGYMQ